MVVPNYRCHECKRSAGIPDLPVSDYQFLTASPPSLHRASGLQDPAPENHILQHLLTVHLGRAFARETVIERRPPNSQGSDSIQIPNSPKKTAAS